MSSLFRFHNYSPLEKAYAVILSLAGLSLRSISGRHLLVYASREPAVIVLDPTGVEAHGTGSWLERGYGRRRRYVKIRLSVNAVAG